MQNGLTVDFIATTSEVEELLITFFAFKAVTENAIAIATIITDFFMMKDFKLIDCFLIILNRRHISRSVTLKNYK
jgi:hypothetical protein